MRFEDVLSNGTLWATVYDGEKENVLTQLFTNWLDPLYLRKFFTENIRDLESYFKITNVDSAVFDTFQDATSLACLILDLNPEVELDILFRPLENSRIGEMVLSREKAKGKPLSNHSSWLRLYAIRVEENVFLITGGAIKLTRTMREREHTLKELNRMEQVRNYLINEGVVDLEGLKETN